MKRFCVAALAALLMFPSLARSVTDLPKVGGAAPDFTLQSQEGKSVSLKDYHGQWVVLYFYPKDFTGGCTLEAHNFQGDLAKYTAHHAVILGVSYDTVESHKSFCAKEGLNFKLLSDSSGEVSGKYDSTMLHGLLTLSARNTFLINPEGVIAKVYTGVNPAGHSAQVLADLDKLQAAKQK